MTYNIHPVILCGGSGTRLWPLSKPAKPKQFLSLTSNQSMIEETADRVSRSLHDQLSFDNIMIVGSKRHQQLLEKMLPEARKILEPFGRNSAPAVAAACLTHSPDDLVLILAADHDIQNIPAFHNAIAIAAKTAEQDAIVTFGITPTHPATGYGYIKSTDNVDAFGAMAVEEFVEKPDLATAENYLAARNYFWNAGIFLFRAGVMKEALEKYAPEVLSSVDGAIASKAGKTIDLDPANFGTAPNISIDYAIMEKFGNVKTVPVDMGWSDVGGFGALHEILTTSERQNYSYGPVHMLDTQAVFARSEGPTIALSGVSNLVVVATKDEVMITLLKDDASVKALGSEVEGHRDRQGFSLALQKTAQSWLWDAFEVWSQRAWDTKQGGFVEQLDLDGAPDLVANRRTRVQARQVFSFAKAVELGWPKKGLALELVEQGLEHLDTRLRHPDGGWIHIASPEGAVIDQHRALYDHAFVVLAGSAAYQATQSNRALRIAEDAVAFIETGLKDLVHGGWFEADPNEMPRRANPHMHMLEAMLAYHSATGREQALRLAGESVRLFETRFFNPANDVMAEFFTKDWRPETSYQDAVFEPGHHYEWASLLSMYDELTGHDTLSWRRRLIRRADTTGRNSKTGFAVNAVRANGTFENSQARLWHQLEMFRAYLLHPGVAPRARAEDLLERIFETYLNAGPKGGWVDEIDADGKPVAKAVPASMLYHAVTAFAPLI